MGSFGLVNGFLNNDSGCDWICDECGAYLNSQPRFTTANGRWECAECGAINDVSENNILEEADDGDDLLYDSSVLDEVPAGCRACGGNYPHCVDSCPLFDD